ncbi:MAG: hypothetical protein HUJ99_05770, partial [Bacteroidaceae bacterium]|nr:hypothetical protein [Bacteroidaceae bacterium]
MAEDLRWYVLRAAQPLKAADRMKELKAELNGEIPTFKDLRVPIRYVAPQKRALMKRDHPMVFNYLFVLARLKDISSFLARYPELKTWVLSSRWTEDADHNYRRTAPSISQTEIEDFFRICDAIAKVEAHYIPFVNITEEKLKEGELVKVIGGFFDGHTGYLMDQKDDTVVLQMMDGLGAPVKIKGAVLERVNVRGVKNAKYALFDDFFSRVNP